MKELLTILQFLLLLIVLPVNAQQFEPDSSGLNKFSKAFTPKFSLNVSVGYGIPFGKFSKVRFGNANTTKELESQGYAEGGFAEVGITADLSVGVKVGKNWGVLGRVSQTDFGINEKSVNEELSKFYHDTKFKILEAYSSITTYTLGYYRRNRFNKMKRVFYEYRGSLGIAYSIVPILRVEGAKRDPISGFLDIDLVFNKPNRPDFESIYKKIGSPVFIGGGSIGYAPSRFFAITLSSDVLVSRVVYKDIYIGSRNVNVHSQTRTFSQFITAVSTNFQLSFFF